MQPSDIQKYCDLMEQIKQRTSVINAFGNRQTSTLFEATNVECVYLQLRKILELIALGSLVANKVEFSKVYSEFSKCWHAQYLLRDIERVNPGFYPIPAIENPNSKPGGPVDLQFKEDGFLTKKDFIKLYEKCGKILHAKNPYDAPIDYASYEKAIQGWLTKITRLLSSHVIRLINDPNLYLIHMNEPERGGKAHHYVLAPINCPDEISK